MLFRLTATSFCPCAGGIFIVFPRTRVVPSGMRRWIERFRSIMRSAGAIPDDNTGSRYLNNKKFWNDFKEIDPGKIAGWIFSYEEKGMRMKA